MAVLTRAVTADLEVRSEGGGRTIAGIVCPYDAPTEITEWGVRYTEQFARGAFSSTIARPKSAKFLGQHDRQVFPLGVWEEFRDDAAGLWGQARLSKTTHGNDALELVRDGAVDGFSVGFSSIDPAHDAKIRSGSLVTRNAVHLSEVSLVTYPAYDGARVSEIRSAGVAMELGMLLERVGKTHSAATNAQLQKVLDLIASADDSVDEALVELSGLMGVPNPDDDKETSDPSGSDEGRGRALLELAVRRARFIDQTRSR